MYDLEKAEILSVQKQDHLFCLWGIVDSDETEEYREITSFGTGHRIPEDWNLKFIDTVQDGGYVWHFFEVLK